MKRLWAPWRLEYILQSSKKVAVRSKSRKTCCFCLAARGKPDCQNLVVHKGRRAFVILNKYPYTNGHLMVIPYRHLDDYTKLTPAEHAEMGALMRLSIQALKKIFHAQGFNLGMNVGDAAGAGIRDHLHYHVVPRWVGDHNFMPVVSDLKVLAEAVAVTHARLMKVFGG